MDWPAKLQVWMIRLSAAAVVVQVGMLAVFWKLLPPEVPLWYSRPWGNDQLVQVGWLAMPPILSAVVGIGGGLVAHSLGRSERLLGGIIMISVMVIQLVATLGLVRIVQLVL